MQKGNNHMIIDEIRNKKILPAGEAVRYGFSAIKKNLMAVMYILLIIYFPINILSGYISLAAENIQVSVDITEVLTSTEMMESFVTSPEYIRLAMYNFMSLIIETALSPFGAMAVIYIVKNSFEEKETSFKEALSVSFSNGWRFICSMVIYSVCVSLLSILGIIPGVFLGVAWHFYLQAIVLDDCRGISSLGFSRRLVKGRWWKTFWYIVVFYCMNYVASYLIEMIFALGQTSYMSVVIMGLILSFLEMIFVSAKTVVYINYQGSGTAKEQ